MLYRITVRVERLLQKHVFVEFMLLKVICMYVAISLLTSTSIYMRSATTIKCYIKMLLYTPIFSNILSKIALQIT